MAKTGRIYLIRCPAGVGRYAGSTESPGRMHSHRSYVRNRTLRISHLRNRTIRVSRLTKYQIEHGARHSQRVSGAVVSWAWYQSVLGCVPKCPDSAQPVECPDAKCPISRESCAPEHSYSHPPHAFPDKYM